MQGSISYYIDFRVCFTDILFFDSGADENKQQTIINRDSLELGKELGQGEFGSVLMGVWVDPVGERVCAFQSLHH